MVIDLIMLSNFGRGDGGRETWAYGFLPHLLQLRRDVVVRVLGSREEGGEDNSAELLAAAGDAGRGRFFVKLLPLRRRRWPLFVAMVRKVALLPAFVPPPDVTLALGGAFEVMLMLLRRGRRGTKVVWLRGIFLHEKAERVPRFLVPAATYLENWLLGRADLLLANGDDIAEHYKQFGFNPIVIKNSVSPEKWRVAPPRLGSPVHVAYIGRLAKVKGIEEFCALVERVKSGPRAAAFDFVVAGDGPYRGAVEALARADLVQYLGHLPNADLPGVLSKVDVCVALTFSSPTGGGGGTSNALLEQMAAGRVMLAWDNTHYRQVVDDSMAVLVPQGSVTELESALYSVATDRAEALSRADAAQREIARYGFDGQVLAFEQALLRIDTSLARRL